MSLRRILHAGPERRTVRIRPEVQELEVIVVLLAKGDAGRAPPDRIDVELDRSVAERDAFEYRIAGVQPHQAVEETQLPEELSVLLRLPVLSGHGDRQWFRARRRHSRCLRFSRGGQ